MSTLWRCDVCRTLIDPVEEDERTVMVVAVEWDDGDTDQEEIDLCADCRPQSLGGHMDWLLHEMVEEDWNG